MTQINGLQFSGQLLAPKFGHQDGDNVLDASCCQAPEDCCPADEAGDQVQFTATEAEQVEETEQNNEQQGNKIVNGLKSFGKLLLDIVLSPFKLLKKGFDAVVGLFKKKAPELIDATSLTSAQLRQEVTEAADIDAFFDQQVQSAVKELITNDGEYSFKETEDELNEFGRQYLNLDNLAEALKNDVRQDLEDNAE